MEIKRELCGTIVKIKLTVEELHQAYIEQENEFDIQDVQAKINEYSEEKFIEEYSVSLSKVKDNVELINSIADAKRLNIDKYDMEWCEALSEAFTDCLFEIAEFAKMEKTKSFL